MLSFWRKKEHVDGPGQPLQRTKTFQDVLSHFFSAAQSSFGHTMVFQVILHLLVRNEFRGVGRQKEQSQLAA
jgi:hypothetical protein